MSQCKQQSGSLSARRKKHFHTWPQAAGTPALFNSTVYNHRTFSGKIWIKWIHLPQAGRTLPLSLAHTFGSWTSLTTYFSWLFLHRTNTARPNEPSPITSSSEYFSMERLQVKERAQRGETATTAGRAAVAPHHRRLLLDRSVRTGKFTVHTGERMSQNNLQLAWCGLSGHYFLIMVWRRTTRHCATQRDR